MLPVSPCGPRPAGSPFLQLSTGQKSADQLCPLQLGPLSHCRQGNLFVKGCAGVQMEMLRTLPPDDVWSGCPRSQPAHCAGGRGRVCSQAQSRDAGLQHCGFLCRRAVCAQRIPQ